MADRTRLEPEFGWYSDWIVDAAEHLDVSHRIAVASRGTGNPALLRMASDAAGIGPGDVVLDVGSGLGGPAAWLEANTGCTTIGFDLMEVSVCAQRRMFPHVRSLVADSDLLPFCSDRFDAAWCLGVLEMIEDKGAALSEIARVLRPGGRVCLYEYAGESSLPTGRPGANRFVTAGTILDSVQRSGLEFMRAERAPELPDPPSGWRDVTRIVREEITRSHAGDPRLEDAEKERQRFLEMRRSGEIEDWIFVARKRPR